MYDLEQLFSPSFWANRFPTPSEHESFHLQFLETENQKVNIPSEVNVSYGTTYRQKIDVLGTDLPNDAPIITFIHGGYWQIKELSKDSYHFLSQHFYKNGIKTMFIGYDLCPDVTFEELTEQIKAGANKCIKYAKEQNSKGIYFTGHSAGGHLVATVIEYIKSLPDPDQNLVKGAIPISGLFDLSQLVNTSYNNVLKLDKSTAFNLSPINFSYSALKTIKFAVVVGENEGCEFIRQSDNFNKKLQSEGVRSSFIKISNVDHFNIIENLVDENFELTKYIIKFIHNDF